MSWVEPVQADWEQEDNFGNPARVNGEEFKEPYCEFALPEDDYGDLKYAKRLAPEGSTSPPSLPHQLSSHPARGRGSIRRHSTVDDTDGEYTGSLGVSDVLTRT